MSELAQATLAVASAVAIYVIGHWIVRFIIEPWLDFRSHCGAIADSINYYANVSWPGIARAYIEELRMFTDKESAGELSRSERLQADLLEQTIRSLSEEATEARKTLRRHATQLLSKAHAIPIYPLFAFLGLVPTRTGIKVAYQNLIGLSNEMSSDHGYSGIRRKEIASGLRISMLTY